MEVSVTFDAPSTNGPKSLENDAKTKSKGNANQRAYTRHIRNIHDDNARLLMKTFEAIDDLQKERDKLLMELDKYEKRETDLKNGNLDADVALTSSNVVVSFKEMDMDDDEVQRRTGFQL